MSFIDFIFACFKVLKIEDLWILCVVLWRVWSNRNLVVHGLSSLGLEGVFEWASDFVDDYNSSAALPSSSSSVCGQVRPTSWLVPHLDKFLLNSDAAIDGSRGVVGFGLVIRNSEGCVMATSS